MKIDEFLEDVFDSLSEEREKLEAYFNEWLAEREKKGGMLIGNASRTD